MVQALLPHTTLPLWAPARQSSCRRHAKSSIHSKASFYFGIYSCSWSPWKQALLLVPCLQSKPLFLIFMRQPMPLNPGRLVNYLFLLCPLLPFWSNNSSPLLGLSFMGAGLGNILGSIVSGRVSDYLLKKARKRRGGAAKREDRLTLNAW